MSKWKEYVSPKHWYKYVCTKLHSVQAPPPPTNYNFSNSYVHKIYGTSVNPYLLLVDALSSTHISTSQERHFLTSNSRLLTESLC